MVKAKKITEEQMHAKVERAATSSRGRVMRIDMADWERVRSSASNKTGWTRKEVDVWASRAIEEGRMVINKTSAGKAHKLMSRMSRVERVKSAGSGPKAERARVQMRVRKWVEKHARGKLVTAAQFRTLKDNLRGRGRDKEEGRGPAVEVEAALLLLAVEEGLQIEFRDAHRAGWVQQAMKWAGQKGWIDKNKADKMGELALARVMGRPQEELVCLELGSGWGGTTQGLKASKQWSRVLETDGVQQNLGLGKGTARPDILARFVMKGQERQGGLFRYFRKRGGVKKGELGAAWISSSCKWASTANGLNKQKAGMKGDRKGFFGGKGRIPKEEKETIDGLLQGIKVARKQDPRFQYAWENVGHGALKGYKKMQDQLGEGTLMYGCAYGNKHMKPYRVWLSPEARKIFRPIHPTDKESLCDRCKKGLPHEQGMCPKKGSKQKRVSEKGQTVQAARNRVTWRMAAHISMALKQAWELVNAQQGNQSGWGI